MFKPGQLIRLKPEVINKFKRARNEWWLHYGLKDDNLVFEHLGNLRWKSPYSTRKLLQNCYLGDEHDLIRNYALISPNEEYNPITSKIKTLYRKSKLPFVQEWGNV